MHTDRVEFLDLKFDRLTFSQVKKWLQTATAFKSYGYIVTPNVDHMVRLKSEPELRPLYEGANLCLCDSRVLRLLARISGIALPLVAGSDLCASLFKDVIKDGDRIAIVGATPDFLDRLRARFPGVEFLHHAPPMGLRANSMARREAAAFLAFADARFTFITVGSPQQEMIANEAGTLPGATGLALCVGAGLEFLTGDQKRAPEALQRLGLEWAHRLATNPKRLWRRYLIEGPRIFRIYSAWMLRGRRKWRAGAVGVVLVAAIGAALMLRVSPSSWVGSSSGQRDATRLPPNASMPLDLPPPDLLRPLSPEEAAKENSERPFVKRPDTPAAKFVLNAAPDDRERALTCLAQAVYYEAAGEGSDGERAVAQVVINRMHHPGYPPSICGVVYQGSERGAGCQFSFTCNGSLLRAPAVDLWSRARRIAEDALSGKVFAPIGHATHYHADYVLPYWADSLDKTVQIGRHIFYRLRSTLGERNAFSQHYAGAEPEVKPPNAAVVLPQSAMTEQLAGALLGENVGGPSKEVEKAAQPVTPPLAADLGGGSLIVDGQPLVAAPKPRTKPPMECAAAGESKKLSPLEKADLRAGGSALGC
jgi:N-acetylglucosaminyldiphosphoundecaprenol N-acetyl-beta-D-mannosaminyltransferase